MMPPAVNQVNPFFFLERSFVVLRDLCTDGGGFRRQYASSLIAGLLLILPIVLFVHRYIDDVGRSMDGEYGWTQVGRPLADLLFFLVNLGFPGIALAPLLQLLSIALVSLVAVVASRAYGIRSSFWSALGSLPLLGNPYALENISYGFDCLAMALSLSLAVVAAVLIQLIGSREGLFASILLLVASLCLYQPGSSAFLPFALMLVVGHRLGLLDESLMHLSTATRIVRVLLSYCLALASYRVVLLLFLVASPSSVPPRRFANKVFVAFQGSSPPWRSR
jgi:hypothetical protein